MRSQAAYTFAYDQDIQKHTVWVIINKAEMNVLLINPTIDRAFSKRYSYFPIGLAYLLSTLEKEGYKTKVLDFNANPEDLTEENIKNEVKAFGPSIAGIGCLFSNYYPSLTKLAGMIKDVDRGIKVVIGGLHPTLFYDQILSEHDSIDFVMLGESEQSLVDLCRAVKSGNSSFGDIDGMAYRENGDVRVNPKTSFIDDLDSLPFPAYESFDLSKYHYHNRYSAFKKNTGMSVLTSRSCPNRCTFCSMFHSHGKRWRPRSARNVIDEVEHLYKNHGIRHFMFMDDNMTLNKKRTLEIFRGITGRGMKITFDFPNGVSIKTIDRQVMEAIKEAGCQEMPLPIESGSERIRNEVIKKRLPEEKIFKAIELCNEFDIETIGLFVLGMPGEDHESVLENLEFVRKLKGNHAVDFISMAFATPFPGTALFEQCVREKLIDEETISSLVNGTIQTFDKPVINLPTLSKQELLDFRKAMMTQFIKQNLPRLAIGGIARPTFTFRVLKAVWNRFLFNGEGNR